ncbi:MAG: DUF3422 domain-containing protein [Marinibacterium sp.]|nr:DUF3422 domain-containing protein [Marinibacterium sp.]
MPPIADHSQRYDLANELHARPFPRAQAPATVSYIAIKRETGAVGRDRDTDRAHLVALLDRHGVAHPAPGATHYAGRIGRHLLKWEQHSEFVTYTAISEGVGDRAFDPADFDVFPDAWLGQAPGVRVTSILMRVAERLTDAEIEEALDDWFVSESLAVCDVLDGDGVAAGDFRIDPAGHMRFAVFVRDGTGERRVGRIIQRLCEIETYKSMSMLGFSRVRGISAELGALDARLTELVHDMAGQDSPAADTLTRLLSVSERFEALAAHNAYRFGATGAYEAIVGERIATLRESRFRGRQTFSEFMMRRYQPAMRTVQATELRLQRLADRAMRAGELLRTRVDVDRSAQNQALMERMDRRADLQLRLQRTVEGLSVVAISYYAVSLAGYLLYPLAAALGLSEGTVTAAVTLPVVAAVWWSVRHIRKRLG